MIPRIYDNEQKCSKSLKTYEKLKQVNGIDERLFKALLLGLSTRDYEQVVGNMLDSFGLSASSVSPVWPAGQERICGAKPKTSGRF